MKKTYYLLLFVLMSASVKAQTGWITQNLDEKLSIKFPAQPQKTTKNGFVIYTLREPDSMAYSVAMLDYKVVLHLDSAALAPMKDNQQFANQLRAGIASKKTNYTFGDITIGKWNTYATYSMSASENINKDTLLIQMILIGSKMYSLACRIPANMTTKNNEVFFGSFGILK
jgi:hypothetical protein